MSTGAQVQKIGSVALSAIISIAAIVYLGWAWITTTADYVAEKKQLASERSVTSQLSENGHTAQAHRPTFVTTGFFIQAMNFVSASDVNITGYIWARYDIDQLICDATATEVEPSCIRRGFVFPEQVYSSNTLQRLEYVRPAEKCFVVKLGESDSYTESVCDVYGWYFDVTLRQPFDYENYPFDRQHVWLRVWPTDFDKNIILVPDLQAYDSTKIGIPFGLDKNIVPGGWEIEETYFHYELETYDTDFGIEAYIGKEQFPELHFVIVVQRLFRDAFVVTIVPLILITLLLFGELLMLTSKGQLAQSFGSTTAGLIGTATALMFVVTIAHVQLRQEFPGADIVYIEWFYLFAYLLIFLVTANSYLFTRFHESGHLRWLTANDNRIAKLFYWPIVLGALVSITQVVLF